MRRCAAMLLVLIVGSTAASPAAAQSHGGESSLNPWAVTAEVFVNGGESAATAVRGLNCHEVEAAIDAYNAERDLGDWIWTPPLSDAEENALRAWINSLPPEERPGGFTDYDLAECTVVHVNGWKPATDSILNAAGGGFTVLVINTTGPLGCTGHGEVLMATSSYYWWNGAWQSFFGTNWVENPGGGVLAQGDVDFECVEIIPGGAGDFASVADAVPTSQVNVNPTLQGLTGLDTWLWYDFSTPDSSQLTIPRVVSARGTLWNLVANVWVDRVHWDVDCASSCTARAMASDFNLAGYEYLLDLPDTFNLSSDPMAMAPADVYDGGQPTEDGAAASHVYRTKDGYTVSTATVWRGFWQFQGISYPYDPVVVAEGVGYDVVEIRSVLVNPDV